MNSIQKDSRFSKVLTDPRFLPMPTYERKVKIDKRFNALFTSKDFGHRHLQDKRGRPIHDVSKRSKHVMEQYYDISSDDSSSDEEDGTESDSDENEKMTSKSKTMKKDLKMKTKKKTTDSQKSSPKKKRVAADSDSDEDDDDESSKGPVAKKAKKGEKTDKKAIEKDSQKPLSKKKRATQESDDVGDKVLSKKAKKEMEKSVKISKQDEQISVNGRHKKKKQEEETDSEESDDEEDGSENDNKSGDDSDSEDEEEESSESEEDSSSSDGDDDSDDNDGIAQYTTEFDLEDTAIEHKWNELHKEAPSVSESTRRLAVCNMDWDFVKAQDLFVLFKSFAGEGGSVHSVTIYPSQFGKERMAEEAVSGPKEMKENLKREEDMKKELDKKRKRKTVDGQVLKRMEKQIVNAEQEVLRNYQLNRLRYYYAVVDCSSVEVADNIYTELDGQEYQLSGVALDLRFIPDDLTFEGEYKEMFSDKQGLVDYTPKLFSSSALSQAKVEVTWDETEFDRLRKRMLLVQSKEMVDIVEENRYADIIAPPESDSDLDDEGGRPQWLKSILVSHDDDDEDAGDEITEERKIELYRQVLMDKITAEEDKEKKDNEVDKELTWQTGIKAAVVKGLIKTKTENEESQGTLVDDYLQKKKEKKKKKRVAKFAEKAKTEDGSGDDDEVEDGQDEMPDFIDNSLKQMMESEGVDVDSLQDKKKKKKDKKNIVKEAEDDSEAEREKAELELLMMGDEGDSKSRVKPETEEKKGKLSRRQKKKRALEERDRKKKEKEEVTIDVEDQRFSAMFSSHHFHIDPSAPEFKSTDNMMKLVDEQIKRKPKMSKGERKKLSADGASEGKEEEDSRAVSKKLVESLKKKMKKR